VRGSLLQSQDQLAELEAGGGIDNQPEMLKELDRRNQEILELRDLLIGKDAELGAAKGRVAELADHAQRVSHAKQRIESKLPFLGQLARAFARLRARS
jgi:hypothetical protein